MTTAILTTPAANNTEIDPVQARAEFFLELEMLELTATIPQAQPAAFGVAKY
jgi:hypothetical protein